MPSNRNVGMSKTRMSFFRGMSTEHLVRIVATGGGIRFNARGRSTDDSNLDFSKTHVAKS
jgi:hypothetical protein